MLLETLGIGVKGLLLRESAARTSRSTSFCEFVNSNIRATSVADTVPASRIKIMDTP